MNEEGPNRQYLRELKETLQFSNEFVENNEKKPSKRSKNKESIFV